MAGTPFLCRSLILGGGVRLTPDSPLSINWSPFFRTYLPRIVLVAFGNSSKLVVRLRSPWLQPPPPFFNLAFVHFFNLLAPIVKNNYLSRQVAYHYPYKQAPHHLCFFRIFLSLLSVFHAYNDIAACVSMCVKEFWQGK